MDPVALIKDKLNIIDVITPYIQLRKRGTNWFGLCPFHNERTGSFSVNEDRGFFHCFGCGESGDIFSFVEKIEHTDFRGALEILARQANVDISNANYDNKYNEKKGKLIEINELTKKFYTWILKEHKLGERGREYLKKRNIKDKSIDKYGLGYAPIGYDNIYKMLIKKGYTNEEILESGVCVKGKREGQLIDKFRGRLMFPIENISGNTIGFSGRYIPVPNPKFEPPKYLNTGETLLFNKGKILYGFNQAKDQIVKRGFVILSEGQVNIISSWQIGEENIVASMGTAFTIDHLKLISRYTKNIYFCFDNDNAGKNALLKGIKMALSQDFTIRVIRLREGSDPDEEIQKNKDLWKGDIGLAVEAFDYLIEEAKKSYKSIEDKKNIISNFTDIYASCINPVTKDMLLQKLSTSFDLPYETLTEFFTQQKSEHKTQESEKQVIVPSQSLQSSDTEEFTLSLICQHFDSIKSLLNPDHEKYFIRNGTIYKKLIESDLENLLSDIEYQKTIEKLLTKNLPETDEIENAYKDCIRTLSIRYMKNKINSLKEELSFADENKQEEILTEIDNLIIQMRKG